MPSDWEERIHGFLKPEEDKPEHFAAIGRLITAFNGVDVFLNRILRHQLGAESQIGRAVIGGMRTGDMLRAIKRLAKASDMDPDKLAKLEELMTDIQALKSIRDDAAHKIWAVNANKMALSNFHLARSEQSAEIVIYSIEELNELARYAPYLSQRALDLFPDAIIRYPDDRLPVQEKPARLRSRRNNPQ